VASEDSWHRWVVTLPCLSWPGLLEKPERLWHLRLMLRLYRPCLPTRALRPPTGPHWIHEIKHDGFRIVARRIHDVVRLQTKQGFDYASRYPLIVEAILRLKV
jgi:hypothetical protein